jgi:Collagen triple helix repeat (20 copies)
MLKRSLPSPALVIACLALFVALGGTGYAATQLSQGEGQATASKKTKQGPRGPKGPKGPKGAKGAKGAPGTTGLPGQRGAAGATGAQGAPGERGPSDGAIASVPAGVTEIGKAPDKPKVIVTLSLGPGKWMVTGQASLTDVSESERSAWCSLNANGTQLGIAQAIDALTPPTVRNGDATVLGAVDLPAGGIVELRCWAEQENGGNGDLVFLSDESRPTIQAIQVGTLTEE